MQTVIENERHSLGMGLGEIDDRLGGGVPEGSLILTEGAYDGAENPLARYLLCSALRSGLHSVYFTFQDTAKSILDASDSLGVPVEDYFLLGRVRVNPLTAGECLGTVLDHIKSVPDRFQFITVDSITYLMADSDDDTVVDFFSACKEMCADGRTINLVVHSRSVDRRVLSRARALCDGYLRLRLKSEGERLVKTLEMSRMPGTGQRHEAFAWI